jgi:ribosome recycling factor
MMLDFIEKTRSKMDKTIKVLKDEFTHIRTGRASSTLIDRLEVPYYGVSTPLKKIANISVPESNLIVIQPWDKNCLGEIEKAIWKSDLGLTPSSDGNLIRLTIPTLNEERRKELVKLVKKEAENGKVSIRNVRREINELIKKDEKSKIISEDDCKEHQKEIQVITDEYIKKIDEILAIKEKEILEV